MKNQKLTGHDGDANIRQENVDILKMKKQLLDQQRDYDVAHGEAEPPQTKPKNSILTNYRVPNIERILNEQVEQYEDNRDMDQDKLREKKPSRESNRYVKSRMHLSSSKD